MAVVGGAAPVPQAAAPLSDGQLLLQAVLRAADELELSRTALAKVLGKDRSTLNRAKGIEPASKTGELALLLIRLYRSLSILVDNDRRQLRPGFTPPTAIPAACRPSRCSAPRGWLKSCSTSTPCTLQSER
jgi:hypothetical protein